MLALLLLVACVGSVQIDRKDPAGPVPHIDALDTDTDADTGAVEDSDMDTAGDTAIDTDTDTDIDSAEALCVPAWGNLSSEFDGARVTEVRDGYYPWPIAGTGAVCSAVCTDPWAFVFLCEVNGNVGDWIELPAEMPVGVYMGLCEMLAPPADVSGHVEGTCVAETSSGTWTLAYALDL